MEAEQDTRVRYRAPEEDSAALLQGREKMATGARIYLNGKTGSEEIPDIIDIRLLMGSKDELVLPKETEFTQSDVRTLVILPYRSIESAVFPMLEYFCIFFFSGIVRLISSNRLDIAASWLRSLRLEHHRRRALRRALRHRLLCRPRLLHLAQHQSLQLHALHSQ